VTKINDFDWKGESYDLLVPSGVREDQSVDFCKLRLLSIGPVVSEIWGEDSLQRWEWPSLAMKEWPHELVMLIEVRIVLYIDLCQLCLEPIGPGGVEIWGHNFLHWVGFGIWGRNGIL